MADVVMEFKFKCADDNCTEYETFCTELGFDEDDIDEFIDQWLETANSELDEDDDEVALWECVEYTVCDWDDDYGNPDDFSSLRDYSEYCHKIDTYGQAYRLRYEDIGDFDFDAEFYGEWNSVEEWAQSFYEEDCYDIPEHLERHIDWESVANDLQYDHSVYEGGRGVFIFRDC